MATAGCASATGTERFRQRFSPLDPTHFRRLQDVWASSIGLGTYLGDADERTDALYAEAIRAAVACGCNVFDTAINYRCQRSERVIGRTLASLEASGALRRDELLLCTKGGYIPFDGAVPPDPDRYVVDTVINEGLTTYEEIVAGCHCLSPRYLDHALRTSLSNLRVQTIDLYYLHNPEQQLEAVDRDTFLQRLEAAFTLLEQHTREGTLRCYGVATWSGFRVSSNAKVFLSLAELIGMAQRVGGPDHHFRAIQVPYNLAMPEAFSFQNQRLNGEPCSVLDAARRAGMSVMISASLLQSRLSRLPAALAARIPGNLSAAQRAIQFVRSTPGVTTALVGMKTPAHVEDNLALARQSLAGDGAAQPVV